ncbi:MAG: antibiotic biosynthesis monooxygenase [Hyphomonas sp.]|uniref:putative quinol monooxygenase n=1 Tax=Hyphomonas sp. TaxID=87 RepID=UPI0017A9E8C6|nr:putative quinol monooxygenase [Hyphomonas sp.]MBA3070485.1 antibiotic biosynthesis monooxygenase [Hyphomonas sp.]MBU3919742.1 antibiotic biosynthesis monooxygenase [Alphaproteobacteria bacterium]MBU4062015.1 antibiotic biosynthesis monooxygenase [Alphaproteobacteria bacterium]MBU4164951.1 antibiotic biosynthesis monooxygenase [Alphaproteobacteria bacterium]
MILVTGHVMTSPETAAEITRLCIEHSVRSRAEPGCLGHNVHVDCENPSRLMFVEKWADMAALKAHFAVPASGAFVRAIRTLSPEPTAMQIFEAAEIQPVR